MSLEYLGADLQQIAPLAVRRCRIGHSLVTVSITEAAAFWMRAGVFSFQRTVRSWRVAAA